MKKNKITIVSLTVVGIVAALFLINNSVNTPESTTNKLVGDGGFVIYKSASCGCCGVYSSYLKGEDISVEVRNITDMNEIKRNFGIPQQLQSCHTSEVGGYVVE